MGTGATRSKKPLLRTIHTWIGLIAGLLLSTIALTGSVILFRAEFERAALPQPTSKTPWHRARLDDAARELVKLRPDARIRRVHLSSGADEPYVFQISGDDKPSERIVCDSSTGQVLGVLRSNWVDWMVDLHRNLLTGKQGRKVVGAAGIALFLLSGSGLLIWLRGARNWRTWITLRQGPARRFNFELHRVTGLWAYAFLALISFTGMERAFPDTFRQAVQSVTGDSLRTPAPKKIKAKSTLPLEEYVRLGRAAMRDGVAIELRLPESGKGAVDLHLYRAGDLAPAGNHVYLDPASGAVLQIDRIVDRPVGARFLAALAPIHYAQFGGLPLKAAWALFAFTPLVLFVTGLIVWWRPKPKARQTISRESSYEELALVNSSPQA